MKFLLENIQNLLRFLKTESENIKVMTPYSICFISKQFEEYIVRLKIGI